MFNKLWQSLNEGLLFAQQYHKMYQKNSILPDWFVFYVRSLLGTKRGAALFSISILWTQMSTYSCKYLYESHSKNQFIRFTLRIIFVIPFKIILYIFCCFTRLNSYVKVQILWSPFTGFFRNCWHMWTECLRHFQIVFLNWFYFLH